jgi:tetratricopeptide (TPR) repeat protein
VESLVVALQGSGDHEACARAAKQEIASLSRGPSLANAAAIGLHCSVSAPASAPWRAEAIAALEPRVREALTFPDLLADDRSGLYDELVQAREAQGDKEGVKQVAGDWLRFLEGEAARAPSPEARAAFDSHLVVAALKLGEPGRVVSALLTSERDLPRDYNPPARLALVYSAMGRHDEALAAADRALSRVYGPRRIRVLQSRANIYVKMGDSLAARRTLEEAVQFAESLPKGQRSEKTIERLKTEAVKVGQAASR